MARDYGTPAPAVEESASRMSEAPPKAMMLESVTIRPVENGFVVQCSRRAMPPSTEAPAYQPPKEYAFNTADDALRYAAQELGSTAEPEAEADEVPA